MTIAKLPMVLAQIAAARAALDAAEAAATADGNPTTQAQIVQARLIDAEGSLRRAQLAALRSEDSTDFD